MTAVEMLAQIISAGGQVIADPERPRLLVPAHLKPLAEEHREALRALVLQQGASPAVVSAYHYHAILRRVWAPGAEGADANPHKV